MTVMRLDPEQRELLELVHAFAVNEVAPRAAADEAAGAFPADLMAQLGSMDLMGLPFDAEYGGSGQPFGVYLRVVEALATRLDDPPATEKAEEKLREFLRNERRKIQAALPEAPAPPSKPKSDKKRK